MLKKIRSILSASNEVVEQPLESKYLRAKTSYVLLSTEKRKKLLLKIKRLFSVTDEVWDAHYLSAIQQFALIVQELPASEIHHHSKEGGLLDHTLEALHAGMRIAQGYVLPPNTEPEKIAPNSDRWKYGVFIAVLAHDLGKVVTDIEVVTRSKGENFKNWHPWYGSIPLEDEYTFRYRNRAENPNIQKTLHEKASMSLLPKLVTEEAAHWIFQDVELLGQLFSTVTHSTFGGAVIAEIVRKADGSSVAKNLGADTGTDSSYSTNIPLHEKLIVALRKLIADGDLKRNRPGAALWVSNGETWLVSKVSMETVKSHLLAEGHKSIPNNVLRMYETLNDHDLLIPTESGDSVWTAEVQDLSKNWNQKLTFLRFKNEILWPGSTPDEFDGHVVPVDKNGKAVVETTKPNKTVEPQPKYSEPEVSPPPSSADLEAYQAMQQEEQGREVAPVIATTTITEKKNVQDPEDSEGGITSAEARQLVTLPKRLRKAKVHENDFIAWIIRSIESRKLKVNEPKAQVHILDDHVAIVTPMIFITYFNKNPMKTALYESRAADKKIYTLLQKELEGLGIHQKSKNGENLIDMFIEGQRKQAKLKVYLLHREYFPMLAAFSSNKVMRIDI